MEKLKVPFHIEKDLEEDIDLFLDAYNNKELHDCEMSNLLASINASEIAHELTYHEARLLRRYYIEGRKIDNIAEELPESIEAGEEDIEL